MSKAHHQALSWLEQEESKNTYTAERLRRAIGYVGRSFLADILTRFINHLHEEKKQ